MSTLPKNTPFIKRFLNGDWGWAHAAQEGGAFLFFVLVSTWLISIALGLLFAAFIYKKADQYWLNREVKQSLKMKRVPTKMDARRVPDKPNGFWTADAIADVKFPRKTRPAWLVVSLIGAGLIFMKVGLFGVLIPF